MAYSSYGYGLKLQRQKKREEQRKVERDQRLKVRAQRPSDRSDNPREASLDEVFYRQEQGSHSSVSGARVPTRRFKSDRSSCYRSDTDGEHQPCQPYAAAKSCREASSTTNRPASRRKLKFLDDDSSDDECIANMQSRAKKRHASMDESLHS